VVGTLADKHMREGTLGGQTSFDQMCRCWCLGNTLGAPAAGIFGTDGDDDPQLRGHDVQPIRAVFSDPVHLAAATRTEQAIRLDHPFEARKARRKMPAIAARGPPRRREGRSLRILPGLGLGHGSFEILEGQRALVVAQSLGALAIRDLVQLGNEMLQRPVCFPQRIPLVQHCQHSSTLVFRDGGKIDRRGGGHVPIIDRSS